MNIFIKILFAVIYTVVYVYLAIDNAGAGHGTLVFFAPLLTWPLPIIAIFLSSKLDNRIIRLLFIVLMAIHHLVSLLFVGDDILGDAVLAKRWEFHPYFTLFTVLWYLLGQLVIWTAFFGRKSQVSTLP